MPSPPSEILSTVWPEAAKELARLLRAMGTASARVDDLLQDVYLAALRQPPPEMAPGDLRRWLFRVAINRGNLEHRHRGRWRRLWQRWVQQTQPRGNHHASASTVVDAASEAEDRERVRRALGQLPTQIRTIFVLRYFAELDSGDIAKILDMPDSTVRSHLRAGRQQLALELKRAGDHND